MRDEAVRRNSIDGGCLRKVYPLISIEHIMPQHLTPAWNEILGANAAEIHATWLHRLANLTLTGYNPSLSNNTFNTFFKIIFNTIYRYNY